MEIMIRSPKLQDYDRFSNIMEQTQALHVDWRPDVYKLTNPFITKEIFQTMIKSGSWYVAEINNMAVGVMELTKRHVESPSKATKDILFIDSIAVDREYRGKGIGRRLFEKAKQIKEESCCDTIELHVNAKNKAAYEIYKHCGFTEKSIHMELK